LKFDSLAEGIEQIVSSIFTLCINLAVQNADLLAGAEDFDLIFLQKIINKLINKLIYVVFSITIFFIDQFLVIIHNSLNIISFELFISNIRLYLVISNVILSVLFQIFII
jgi:hypothetical protein